MGAKKNYRRLLEGGVDGGVLQRERQVTEEGEKGEIYHAALERCQGREKRHSTYSLPNKRET